MSSLRSLQLQVPVLLLALAGCMQGPAFLGSGAAVMHETPAGVSQAAAVVSEQDGTVLARITDVSSTQTISGGATGDIAGSQVSFPPGSLALGTEVTMQTAAAIATDSLAVDLGLTSGVGVQAAGAAVVITSSTGLDPVRPFVIALPLPDSSGLNLDDPLDRLIVVYKVTVAGEEGLRLGILTRGSLTIENGKVLATASYFGAFQVAFSSVKIDAPKEAKTSAPIVTKAQEKQLPDVTWTGRVAPAAGRSAAFSFTVNGLEALDRCIIYVDRDQAVPFDTVVTLGPQTTYQYTPTARDAFVVSARLGCRDKNGREGTSPWIVYSFAANPVTLTFDTPAEPANITAANVTAFTIGGACSESGRLVTWSGSVQGSAPCTAGRWAGAIDLSKVPDGAVTLQATLSDAAGNAASPVTRVLQKKLGQGGGGTAFAFQGLYAVNEASDYVLTATDLTSQLPLFALQATGYSEARFSKPQPSPVGRAVTVGDGAGGAGGVGGVGGAAASASICGPTLPYDFTAVPPIKSLAGFPDGPYIVCVRLSSASGQMIFGTSDIVSVAAGGQPPPPTVTIAGAPQGTAPDNFVNVTFGGPGIVSIKFKFGDEASTDCTDGSGYSDAVVPGPQSITVGDDGPKVLCAVGADGFGTWQPFAFATMVAWAKGSVGSGPPGPPSSFTGTLNGNQLLLTWAAGSGNPTGYILVQKIGAPITSKPVDGQVYAGGSTLPSGDSVLAVTMEKSYTVSLPGGSNHYYYGLWAYGGNQQFSVPVFFDYDTSAGSWNMLPAVNAPSARADAASVWMPEYNQLFVWGGMDQTSSLGDGRFFDFPTNAWQTVEAINAPAARSSAYTVWTGTKVLIWGGIAGGALTNTGAAYDMTQSPELHWSAMTSTGAPSARHGASAVWSGSQMVIFGGQAPSTPTNNGGRYNMENDTWSALTVTGAPSARFDHAAIWVPDLGRMIVWGGNSGSGALQDGGFYDPAADQWDDTHPNFRAGTGAPANKNKPFIAWTGTQLVVYGSTSEVGLYDPVTDTWSLSNPPGAAVAVDQTMVWTGSRLISWGNGPGAVLDPVAQSWTQMPAAGAPSPRTRNAGFWTGSSFIVWGGFGAGGVLGNGGMYFPPAQ